MLSFNISWVSTYPWFAETYIGNIYSDDRVGFMKGKWNTVCCWCYCTDLTFIFFYKLLPLSSVVSDKKCGVWTSFALLIGTHRAKSGPTALEESSDIRTYQMRTMNVNRKVHGNLTMTSQDTFYEGIWLWTKELDGSRLTDQPQS